MPLDALLDDRKVTVLKATIKTYLETGELMGSGTVPKCSDLKLNSATIRNEMSNLEETECTIQSHTLVRRTPSDKGYRSYVDQIMLDKKSKITELKEMIVQKVDKLELVLKKVAQVLAANTNHTAMIGDPNYHKTKLKFVQLSKIEKHKLLVIVAVEGNIIKNVMIDIEDNLSDEELLNLSILLNSSPNELTIEEINLDVIGKLKSDTGNRNQVVDPVLSGVAETIRAGGEDLQTYTSGATNIFKYPELSDGDKTSRLVDTLEHKEMLQEFVGEVNSRTGEETGIQVYIGDESPAQPMKDCNVIIANYDLEEGLRGAIGIIGPKRMDYKKVLGTLRSPMDQLDTAFKKDERW